MSGLYYKYGTMNSSKTANLLMVRFNYIQQGFNVRLLKPAIDTRENASVIKSRVGLAAECTLIDFDESIYSVTEEKDDVIMVDECQFLSKRQVEELYRISEDKVVMCFGLLTDFKRNLFPGAQRLIELADSIHEIKSICNCGRRAVVNARFVGDVIQTEGEQVVIGAEEKYRALCRKCYDRKIHQK